MSAHTPGPWKVVARLSGSENHRGYHINSDALNGYGLASVQPFDEDGIEGGANARLIAAAPEMLEALEYIIGLTGYANCDICNDVNIAARAAIAKATE